MENEANAFSLVEISQIVKRASGDAKVNIQGEEMNFPKESLVLKTKDAVLEMLEQEGEYAKITQQEKGFTITTVVKGHVYYFFVHVRGETVRGENVSIILTKKRGNGWSYVLMGAFREEEYSKQLFVKEERDLKEKVNELEKIYQEIKFKSVFEEPSNPFIASLDRILDHSDSMKQREEILKQLMQWTKSQTKDEMQNKLMNHGVFIEEQEKSKELHVRLDRDVFVFPLTEHTNKK